MGEEIGYQGYTCSMARGGKLRVPKMYIGGKGIYDAFKRCYHTASVYVVV